MIIWLLVAAALLLLLYGNAISATLAMMALRSRDGCEAEIRKLKAQIEQLKQSLARYASCPCPRLLQVEEFALKTMSIAKSRGQAMHEAEQLLGRAVLSAVDPASPKLTEDEKEGFLKK